MYELSFCHAAPEGMTAEATASAEGEGDVTATTYAASAPPSTSSLNTGAVDKAAFDAALFELRKLVDTSSEGTYLPLHAQAEARASRWECTNTTQRKRAVRVCTCIQHHLIRQIIKCC